MKRFATAFVCIALPRSLKPFFLNALGHKAHQTSKIGCSILFVNNLFLGPNTRIGHFNFFKSRRIVMRSSANIGHLNYSSGNLTIALKEHGALGHRNHINGGRAQGSIRGAQLRIGRWSKITAGHFVNTGETIQIGNNTVIAGFGSQLWTHAFIHFAEGDPRAEIRGKIIIGNNVNIGSMTVIQAGVTIGNDITIGAHSVVGKNLTTPGVYVSQPLRFIDITAEARLAELVQNTTPTNFTFYSKRQKHPEEKGYGAKI